MECDIEDNFQDDLNYKSYFHSFKWSVFFCLYRPLKHILCLAVFSVCIRGKMFDCYFEKFIVSLRRQSIHKCWGGKPAKEVCEVKSFKLSSRKLKMKQGVRHPQATSDHALLMLPPGHHPK